MPTVMSNGTTLGSDILIPSDSGLSTVLYSNSSYLWWMLFLFFAATLALVYMILSARIRHARREIHRDDQDDKGE